MYNINYNNNEKFLIDFETLKIPVIEDGVLTWPEKYSLEYINKLRRQTGEKKFLSQMMLEPVDLQEHRFSTDDLIFYDDDLEIKILKSRASYFINNNKIVSACCWWDPALATGGDNSVVSVVFTDENKKYYLHDILYIDARDNKTGENLAIFQCNEVIKFMIKNFVSTIYVESNGLGKFLPDFLSSEIKRLKLPIKVIATNSTQNKETRIIEAFDAVVSYKYLQVNEKIKLTPFLFEYENWHIGTKTHDDGMDSVAGSLSAAPFLMTTFPDRFFVASENLVNDKTIYNKNFTPVLSKKNYKITMNFSPLS